MSSTNPTDFNKALGAAVRFRRSMAGLSQEAVGLHLGITFQQIQKYEKGTNRISVETLIKIAAVINSTPQQLIDAALAKDADDGQAESTESTIAPPDRFRMEAARRLFNLPENRQVIAVNVIKALEKEQAA